MIKFDELEELFVSGSFMKLWSINLLNKEFMCLGSSSIIVFLTISPTFDILKAVERIENSSLPLFNEFMF